MKRQFRIAIMTGAAMALLALAPAPAWAQESEVLEAEARAARERLRLVRTLERHLVTAEERRLTGNCRDVLAYYAMFKVDIYETDSYERGVSLPIEVRADFLRRMEEIALRDCPPGSGKSSISLLPTQPTLLTQRMPQPTGSATSAQSPASTSAEDEPESILGELTPRRDLLGMGQEIDDEIDALRAEFRKRTVECDISAFEEAKRRYLAQLEAQIATETSRFTSGAGNDELLEQLIRERDVVTATQAQPCGEPTDATLNQLRDALNRAAAGCDQATFDNVKSAFLAQIGTLIRRETDHYINVSQDRAGYLEALTREQRRVQDMTMTPCETSQSAPPTTGLKYRPGDTLGGFLDTGRGLLEIFFGAGETEVPPTGIGVTRDGPSGDAPENFAGVTEERVSSIGVDLSAGLRNVRVNVHYSEGDASTAFDRQPISGGFNGAVFGAPAPSGSSGIGSGSAMLQGTTEIDLSRFGLSVELNVAQPSPNAAVFVGANYLRDVRDYRLTQLGTVDFGSTLIEFRQERDQRIAEDVFGLGLGGEVRVPLSESTRLLIRATTAVFLRDAELRSVERNTSNFGPSSDRDFTIEIDDDDSGFGFAGDVRAGVEILLGRNVALVVEGTAAYRSQVGAVFNPNSGDQVFFDGLTTAIATDDWWSYGARVGIRIGLGR